MTSDELSMERVKFYGAQDISVGWQLDRIEKIIGKFDATTPPSDLQDLLELFNVLRYLEDGAMPPSYTDTDRAMATAKIVPMRSAIARYFATIDDRNIGTKIVGVDWRFRGDLIELLGRNGAFKRCTGDVVLSELAKVRVNIGEMLSHRSLVDAYDVELRNLLCSSPSHAEIVIRKYLEKGSGNATFIPSSLTNEQSRTLIESYIDSQTANPNFVRLIADAKRNNAIGLDAKLKLRAKRRYETMRTALFKENEGIKTGYGVSLSESQWESVRVEESTDSGYQIQYTYGVAWLNETRDQPSILNNFMYLFDFCDDQALLSMPSYPTQIGAIEGLFGARGMHDYVTGRVFHRIDALTLMRLHAYTQYLEYKDIYLEDVIRWFFEEHILEEFGAHNFTFEPSDKSASYLSRARHLFAEMESVVNQFTLFAQDGELDRELLSIGGDQVRYSAVPSLISQKYGYVVQGSPLATVLHLLFSDQSHITYINEQLHAETAVQLLAGSSVAYDDFAPHQFRWIDVLIQNGIVENTGPRLLITNIPLFMVLRSLYDKDVVSFHNLSTAGQREVTRMAAEGWITFESNLLTHHEASYFNYFLNSVEHGNGPQLRNKYIHGTQVNGETENEHATAYTIAIRLMISLAIKMNDDFCLSAAATALRE